MSQVILTNWTIWFADDAPAGSAGYKQIQWTGGGGPETNTNTVNELYTEIQHYMSLPENNGFDDTNPMRAVTSTVYEIGSFDLGDDEAWFIDPDSVKHLTGGSIQTTGWTRQGSDSGIVKVAYDTITTDFVDSDIGRAIANGTATGTIVWIDTANSEVWIRPTDSTSTHDWSAASGTISVTGSSASMDQAAAAITGERLWSNVKTIGTIEDNTRIYVGQTELSVPIPSFWGDGHIDRLFLVSDGFTGLSVDLIEDGELYIYARQYNKLYDHFITNVRSGGQTIVPISTADDSNNATGDLSISVSGASGVFTVGEVITGGTAAVAIVTANTGSPTTSFEYYLVDDQTDFVNTETLTGSIVGSNGTASGTSSTVNAATYTNISITFGEEITTFDTDVDVDDVSEFITPTDDIFSTGDEIEYVKDGGTDNIGLSESTLYFVRNLGSGQLAFYTTKANAEADTSRIDLTGGSSETHRLIRVYDVNEDLTRESFSIVINGDGKTLSEIYERLKYLTRRGEVATLLGIEGQQYIGIDYRVDYTTLVGAMNSGDRRLQTKFLSDTPTEFAEATIVHHNELDNFVMLAYTTNGPLETGAGADDFGDGVTNWITMSSGATTEVIAPVKVSPFGTLAGGKFFGARGVYLENVNADDANNYFLTDDSGTVVQPPASVPLTIQVDDENGNAVEGARCRIEETGGTLVTDGSTNSSGTFSDTYLYTIDVDVNVVVRLKKFIPFRTTGTISSSGLSVSVRFIADTIVD